MCIRVGLQAVYEIGSNRKNIHLLIYIFAFLYEWLTPLNCVFFLIDNLYNQRVIEYGPPERMSEHWFATLLFSQRPITGKIVSSGYITFVDNQGFIDRSMQLPRLSGQLKPLLSQLYRSAFLFLDRNGVIYYFSTKRV